MARPRKASDEEVFEAAFRVMQRQGPSAWTLADIAEEAGLTPSALVQRFGSKHRLQVTLVARFADGGPDMYAALRQQHRSPLAALRAYARQVACMARSQQELAHHLDYLRLDLTDPQMHAHFARHARVTRRFISATLRDALAEGELRRGTQVATLTRLVDAVITGSLFTWAACEGGEAERWMRRNLDDLLAAHAPPR